MAGVCWWGFWLWVLRLVMLLWAPSHGRPAMAPSGTLPWRPAIAPGPVRQSVHAPRGTQQWHPTMAPYSTMAPSNGTKSSPPKCTTTPWHPAMAPLHGTLPWHPAMAPSNGTTSNPPKCATLLLEVRTPIAKAIWGKTFAISDSFLSVGQASVEIYAKKLEEGIGSSIPVSVQRDLQTKMRLGNPATVSSCLPVYVPVIFHHGFPSLES